MAVINESPGKEDDDKRVYKALESPSAEGYASFTTQRQYWL
jgi:hypothetical protein